MRNDLSPKMWPIFFANVAFVVMKMRIVISLIILGELPVDVLSFLMTCFQEAWKALNDNQMDRSYNHNMR